MIRFSRLVRRGRDLLIKFADLPIPDLAGPALSSLSAQSRPGLFSRIEGTCLAGDTAGIANKPEPPKPIRWSVYKIASNPVWLGEIEATDEAAAIGKAASSSLSG